MDSKIILYSTDCPKCIVLKRKLADKGIEYSEVQSIDEMLSLGIMEVPVLVVDGELKSFVEAVKWVNDQQEN